ncbi:hypothetical protein [Spirosoma montaniterrae]|uniref:Uncharacterized protein n=1 Tax=Spirosoma montaniterrae TaxID=1178516 RepID=A0A1P9X0D1_9BACT|nr:hypothetical protein [Spirosoma montaniterrae]AQG81097.1 hypothetical protein AWR27_18280 [Spirosoma montaniterrae]
MKNALLSGLIGAVALNLLHETVRQVVPEAPRADVLGKRALKILGEKTNTPVPSGNKLHYTTLAADVASNALYYSAIGMGNPANALWRGTGLGLLAGIGAVTLPGPMGLGDAPTTRTPATTAMTIGWYLTGGLVAAAAYRFLKSR